MVMWVPELAWVTNGNGVIVYDWMICTPKVGLNKSTIEVQILLWVNKPMESFYIQTKTRVSDNSLSSNFGYKSHHSKVCLEKEIVNTIRDYWDYYNH